MAHEPDLFVDVPDRFAVTLSGHTHGGQVRLPFLGRPVVPSAYGQRFAYGHIREEGRDLIVSAGLGCSDRAGALRRAAGDHGGDAARRPEPGVA